MKILTYSCGATSDETHYLQEACRFYMFESAFALMVAFLINVSVISVSGAVCGSSSLNAEDQKSCQDLDLNKASFLLRVCCVTMFTNTLCHFCFLGIWSVNFVTSQISVCVFS